MPKPTSELILDRLSRLHPKRIDLSLDRVERLLAALGHPERHLPPVVHIAGTNGKGSTLAMLAAMLKADGRRVHRYISPHLVRFNERILLDDQPIDEVLLAGSFGSYLSAASAVQIGLVPKLPVLRIVPAGNVAGEGAKMALLSSRERTGAAALVEEVRYVELSDRSEFNERFVSQLGF